MFAVPCREWQYTDIIKESFSNWSAWELHTLEGN